MMKKILVALVIAIGITGAASAQKIGYISTEELISVMPEYIQADKELGDLQATLEKQGMDLAKDLQEKDSAFVADSIKMTQAMKELARNSLIDLYQKVQGFRENMQAAMQRAGQEKMQPIRVKAMDAIKAVAKANGYSYILEVSSVIVGPPGDDVLNLVKKHLGIKDPPPAAGGNKPAAPKQ